MRNGLRKALILLMAACTLFLCAPAAAASMHDEIENDALDMDVTIGFDGMITYGKIMPVKVRVRNFGDDFEGVLAMNAYISAKEYDRYEKEVFIPAGSEREFDLAINVYTRQNTFTAELVRDGEVVCNAGTTPDRVINPAAMLVGVLSTRPQNLKNMNIDPDNDVLGRYELWQTVPLTAETFPEDAGVLGSFGILVIDDIDPSTLPQKQQDLLDGWLRSGKVLLAGGGANAGRNTAFFSRYTGLKLENVTTSDSVLESLEQMLGRSASGRKPSCAVAEYSGAEALATDTEGRGLIYRTTAGGGRIYTTAFEMGDPRLNSESLMNYFWQQLLVNLDQDLYSSVIYNSDSYSSATVTAGYAVPIDAKSNLDYGLLIVAALLVISCVLWAVLKKKDRRQWMWLALPLVSLAAAVAVLAVSTGSETNRPLAVIADNLVQDGAGVIRNYSGISVATPEFGRHSFSVDGENLRVLVYDYVDYDDEDEDKKDKEPTVLRTCYKAGGENSVTAESLSPWDQINLAAENPAKMQGQITGSIWLEEDGMHGEVVNETDATFAPGHIVTTYGYVSVPALAPGGKADFLLTPKTLDPKTNEYEDGGLYLSNPSLYSVISYTAGYGQADKILTTQQIRDREMVSSMISGATDALRHGQGNWSYGAYETSLFMYCARPEGTTESTVKVDGVPVEQVSGLTMMTAEIPFSAVGRTGVVFRSVGMDIPERVEIDENRMPTGEVMQNMKQTYYHSLNETPTFVFSLKDFAGVKVEKLQVVIDSYYSTQCRAYAMNWTKNEWEQIELNGDVQNPEYYLGSDGKLYLQFRSDSQNMYADIPTPLINLEGRLEHAEN